MHKRQKNVEPVDEQDAVERVVAEEAINPEKDSTNSATNEIQAVMSVVSVFSSLCWFASNI